MKSQWIEYKENGLEIVYENGNMDLFGLSFGIQCDRLLILLDVSSSQGMRNYQGETNRGRRVESISSLEEKNTGFTFIYPVFNDWQAKTSFRQQLINRSIADADGARGYNEQYNLSQWSAGIGRKIALYDRFQISGHLMLGTMPRGIVSLKLPGTREIELQTGTGHLREIQVALGYKEQTILGTLNMTLTLSHSQSLVKEGRQAFAYVGSRPVMAVHQPTFKNKANEINLQLGMDF